MLKKILIIGILMCTTSLFGIEEQNIKKEVESKSFKIIKIIKSKDKDKNKLIFKEIENLFDFKVMSKISLGKNKKIFSKKELEDFSIAFEKKLKNYYIDKLSLYNKQKIIFTDTKKIKKNRIELNSIIKGKEKDFHLKYKLFKRKKTKEWFIYDLEIEDVSIIKINKLQFSNYLKENKPQDLINYLKKNK